MAMQTGCRALGVDLKRHFLERSNFAIAQLMSRGIVGPDFKDRVKFEMQNAASSEGPILVDGQHATHIFMFSARFTEDNMRSLHSRLAATDF